jgi:hypothetical protein
MLFFYKGFCHFCLPVHILLTYFQFLFLFILCNTCSNTSFNVQFVLFLYFIWVSQNQCCFTKLQVFILLTSAVHHHFAVICLLVCFIDIMKLCTFIISTFLVINRKLGHFCLSDREIGEASIRLCGPVL